jgi:hypothetical protein
MNPSLACTPRNSVPYDGPVRRFTLITIIVLIVAIAIAGIYQAQLASRGERRFPGPGVTPTLSP